MGRLDFVGTPVTPVHLVAGDIDRDTVGPLEVGGDNGQSAGTVIVSFLYPRVRSPVGPVDNTVNTTNIV